MAIKQGALGRVIDPDAPQAGTVLLDDDETAIADGDVLPPGEQYAPNGEWTKAAVRKFFADCPRRGVSVPRDQNDKKGTKAYAQIFWNGFTYPIEKGKVVMVPAPIAQIVEQSQQEFCTAQAQGMAYLIRDIGDETGPEIPLAR